MKNQVFFYLIKLYQNVGSGIQHADHKASLFVCSLSRDHNPFLLGLLIPWESFPMLSAFTDISPLYCKG
jgi:hypothetical protein